jgi:hypothetical protein
MTGILCEDPTVHNLLSLDSRRSRNLLASLANLTAGGIFANPPHRFLTVGLFSLMISMKKTKDSSLDLSACATNFRCSSTFSKALFLLSFSQLRASKKSLACTLCGNSQTLPSAEYLRLCALMQQQSLTPYSGSQP